MKVLLLNNVVISDMPIAIENNGASHCQNFVYYMNFLTVRVLYRFENFNFALLSFLLSNYSETYRFNLIIHKENT